MQNTSLYPATPEGITKDFTKVHQAYRKQVFIVLAGIALFFLLYLALIAAAGYLVWWAVTYEMYEINRLTILLKIGAVAMAVMFFVFLLKFLFKKHSFKDPNQVELKEQDHPELFAFVRKLSQETGAPFPKKIFVDHQINASVSYDSTVLSLFLPVRKNLLIGLGLVNSLNLSEFKAVLAHEFGHFSQSSMKLGSYVYMANRIIYSMVAERDSWDDLLEQWKRSDIRIAVFAWLLMPFIWLARQLMALMYKVLNLFQSSLSRQMEFHADKVAVSVTGSNAIVNALYRLGPSSEAQQASYGQLRAAFDQGMYTDNLFEHHTKAFEWLSKRDPEFAEKVQRVLPADDSPIFDVDDNEVPDMYSSHPANHLREQNAKADFLAGPVDERSPWVLFSEPEKLAKQVSEKVLRNALNLRGKIEFKPAEQVEDFIAQELAELTFDERYAGVYDNRYLTPINVAEATQMAERYQVDEQSAPSTLERLFQEVAAQMAGMKQHQMGVNAVVPILQGARSKSFVYNGEQYTADKAQEVYERISKAYEDHHQWCQQFDEQTFVVHYCLAKDQATKTALKTQYQDLAAYRAWMEILDQLHAGIQEQVASLQQERNIDEEGVVGYATAFHNLSNRFAAILEASEGLQMPKQFEQIGDFRRHLLEERPTYLPNNRLEGSLINRLIDQVDGVRYRANRLYYKGVGRLLKLQESIREAAGIGQ
jgi:Zn-dependent protease with chaperone function